jgi:hypothetical protein
MRTLSLFRAEPLSERRDEHAELERLKAEFWW